MGNVGLGCFRPALRIRSPDFWVPGVKLFRLQLPVPVKFCVVRLLEDQPRG